MPAEEILRISAKTGDGVTELLDAIVERIPPPVGEIDAPLQALIFDSIYDPYRGVISSVRVFDGTLTTGDQAPVPPGERDARGGGGRDAPAGARRRSRRSVPARWDT